MPVAARADIRDPFTGPTPAGATPIGAVEFAAAMARLGPFEARPHLAVAVSGGRDSLALVLLAARWAEVLGGRAHAVTVDHGLRAESATEANHVSAWMAGHGISHDVLAWRQPSRPERGGPQTSEASARRARYALLEAFCRDRGILHLLIGHHRDDQDETRMMRRARASGALGLAGMPAVRELAHTRLVRPLLQFPRARITATLQAFGQPWIEDPSNTNLRFARARLRAAAQWSDGETPGLGPESEAPSLRRIALERETARLAARLVAVHPAGYATLDTSALARVDRAAAERLLARVVTCVGGRVYGPRTDRLARLSESLIADGPGSGATLGGCVIRPGGGGRVRIVRELSGITAPCRVARTGVPHGTHLWDGRFQVSVPAIGTGHEARLGAVGQFLAEGVSANPDGPNRPALPGDVYRTLPAICLDGRFQPCAWRFADGAGRFGANARFAPRNPVAGAVFATG